MFEHSVEDTHCMTCGKHQMQMMLDSLHGNVYRASSFIVSGCHYLTDDLHLSYSIQSTSSFACASRLVMSGGGPRVARLAWRTQPGSAPRKRPYYVDVMDGWDPGTPLPDEIRIGQKSDRRDLGRPVSVHSRFHSRCR